jgi:hypothetical protein
MSNKKTRLRAFAYASVPLICGALSIIYHEFSVISILSAVCFSLLLSLITYFGWNKKS